MKRLSILLLLTITTLPCAAQEHGKARAGTVIIQGTGDVSRRDPRVWEEFIRLAGGPEANFVFVPTADAGVDRDNLPKDEFPFDRLKHVTVLHTRCACEAD